MRVAVIDLGTNTFNILVAQKANDNSIKILLNEKRAVFLLKESRNNAISNAAITRAFNALTEFSGLIKDYKCKTVKAYGTSALRTVVNAQNFISKIKIALNIDIEIISGDKEAELIYFGASGAVDIGVGNVLILDIGGGSTEFIIANRNQLIWKYSFKLGGSRMLGKFKPHDPVFPDEITAMQEYFKKELQLLSKELEKNSATKLIGCSGAFDCFASIINYKKHNCAPDENIPHYNFTIEDFEEMANDLLKSSREERLLIPGLDPIRVDTIVMAIIFTQLVLKITNIEKITQSAYSLKEGVALQLTK